MIDLSTLALLKGKKALVTGRPIWLCFRLGESAVEHWHPHDEGFESRRPLAELPTGLGRGSGTPAA